MISITMGTILLAGAIAGFTIYLDDCKFLVEFILTAPIIYPLQAAI